MNTWQRWVAMPGIVAFAACTSAEPTAPSLVGTWNLASFSDSGAVGVTTGTMTFNAGGTWAVRGTVTYPGEPQDSLVGDGTWSQSGVVLTMAPTGGPSRTWDLTFTGNQVRITGRPPVFSVITLTRAT